MVLWHSTHDIVGTRPCAVRRTRRFEVLPWEDGDEHQYDVFDITRDTHRKPRNFVMRHIEENQSGIDPEVNAVGI
jgi:hypothetical protein